MIDAWPVIGFMGLELMVLWGAFELNFNAARRQENILADKKSFSIERTPPNDDVDIDELPSRWLKAKIDPSGELEHNDRRQQKIIVLTHGKSAEIGSFLHPAEKWALLPEINRMIEHVQEQRINVKS